MIIEEPACRAAYHATLCELWERSVRSTHHWFDNADIDALKPTLPAHIDAFSHLLIARVNEKTVGFIGVCGDFVNMLFVDADEQGKGIGSALLNEAEKRFGITSTSVLNDNAAALAFYEKRGYVMIRQDGREKLLMRKEGRSHEAS